MIGRRRGAIALVMLAATAALYLASIALPSSNGDRETGGNEEGGAAPGPTLPGNRPDEGDGPVVPEADHFVTAAEAPTPPPSPPPSPTAAADRAPPRDPGFCPEPGEDRRAYERPSLARLLNDRSDELAARARLLTTETADARLRDAFALLARGEHAQAVISAAGSAYRRSDGFDFASAIAVAGGATALHRGAEVAPILRAARSVADDEAIVHVLAAHAARQQRDAVAAREALSRADRLDPGEPAVDLALGRALSDTPDETAAAAALRRYLEGNEGDIAMRRLAALLELRADLARDHRLLRRGGVTLRYPPSAVDAAAARAALDLADVVLRDAARMLGATPRPELSVVVYRSRAELRAATCVPGWAGGVYDGTLRLAAETVQEPAERERVVRHEGLHAALAAATGPTPYWFNEGLAQRFANERSPSQAASWARIARTGVAIPFPSLDGSFLDIDDPSDARLAYHQSYAMVEWLAARRGPRVFADAVAYLSSGGAPVRLLDELAGPRPLTREDLVEFLSSQ